MSTIQLEGAEAPGRAGPRPGRTWSRSPGWRRTRTRRAEPFRVTAVELRDTPEEAAFRAELRAWIDANLTDDVRNGRFEEAGREWSRKLHEAGYSGLTWPKEYGGGGAPYSHQAIFLEEMARAEAPPHLGVIGLGTVSYTHLKLPTN